jgi:glycosyltransferase involved in cell wall biosynthesis
LATTYGVEPNLIFIGNASALTAQKGYDTLLDAAALLRQSGAPFHLFIAGDGELRQSLLKQCAHLNLEDKTTFLGFIDDVPRFLAGLDILSVPSKFEGLGTILLDGLAAGLAIAASRVGGIPEVIIHGETGLLSTAGDAAGHAANLLQLIRQPQLRQRLNTAGRQHIAAEFSLAAMVGGNLDVYRELLGATS